MTTEDFQSHVLDRLDDIIQKVSNLEKTVHNHMKVTNQSFVQVNNSIGRLEEKVDESLRLYSQFTGDFRKRLEKLEISR